MDYLEKINEVLSGKITITDILNDFKKVIEEKIGKKIDSFQIMVNMKTKDFIIQADGRQQKENSWLSCKMIGMVLKKKLGKDSPDFEQITIHCANDKTTAAMKLVDNSIKTVTL